MKRKVQIWVHELGILKARNGLASFTCTCGCAIDVVFHLWARRTKRAFKLKSLELLNGHENCGDNCDRYTFVSSLADNLDAYAVWDGQE